MNDLKKSRRKIKFGITAAVILLGTAIFLSLQIRNITVSGNKKYTSEQIVDILFKDSWDRNAVFCLYKDRFKKHEQIPFVEDYKIVFLSPVRVEVIVYEKSVVGYVSYMGSYMYFESWKEFLGSRGCSSGILLCTSPFRWKRGRFSMKF